LNIREKLEKDVLPFVERPARYIGGEINAAVRPDVEVSLLLSYPDLYEVGMSHHGLHILYDIVNRLSWAGAERTYAVWKDMEAALRRQRIPLFSLESFRPAAEFDIWGFSLQVELTYTNILTMLDLAGLPLAAGDRPWPGFPLILGGGAGAFNPEPLADFFDLFLIGDGEEAIVEILAAYREIGAEKKEDLLAALVSRVPGLYAPSLYRVEYDESGLFRRILPIDPQAPARIEKRVLRELDSSRIERPLIPVTQIVHDRAVVEIMRGCKRGCRFCQAGWVGRPVREKSGEVIIRQVENLAEEGGFEEVSLLSLSAGDYREIERMLEELSPRLAERKVSLSLPSLNVASVNERILRELRRLRRSGITMAPEAATPRLQRVIKKFVDADYLWEISGKIKELGWRLIKLYFMIGLPTETEDDVTAITEVINRISRWGGNLNVTISNFVPKAATPFQWSPMEEAGSVIRKKGILRRLVPSRRVRLKFHPVELSRIEGILARGDRLLGSVLRAAWEEGCRFDGWKECFDEDKWARAFQRAEIPMDRYLAFPYDYHDALPWDHIGTGVAKETLIREARRAFGEKKDK